MATAQDVIKQRDEAVDTLHDKAAEAISVKKGLPLADPRRAKLTQTINQLMWSSAQLAIQQLIAGLHDAQLDAALNAIKTATKELNQEAAKMKDATSFISKANAVLGAATKVANVLKNGG